MAVEKAMEEINGKLEKDIKNFSSVDINFENKQHSVSSNDPKLDLFASELEMPSNESSEEDPDNSKNEFCDQCLKTFNISLNYCNKSLESILHLEIFEFEQQINSINDKKANYCLGNS